MKTLKMIALIFLCGVTFTACNSDKKSTENDSMMMDSMNMDTMARDTMAANETTETDVDDETATFMKKAAVGGMMEVEAGKAAGNNASSKAVRDFAALMVKDHTMANDELMTIASNKKVMLPAALPAEEQTHLDNMKKMTGKAFDAHYIDMMVTDHAKTVALFKDATKSKHDDVRAFAEKTLKVVEGHYAMIKGIKAKM